MTSTGDWCPKLSHRSSLTSYASVDWRIPHSPACLEQSREVSFSVSICIASRMLACRPVTTGAQHGKESAPAWTVRSGVAQWSGGLTLASQMLSLSHLVS